MVVDNAPCHSNIEEVFSEEEFLGSLRQAGIAAQIVSILAMERSDGLSVTEQRATALTSLIEEELGRVTPEVCNRFITGIQSKIPAAVTLEDVVF